MQRFFRINPQSTVDRNNYYLVLEILWASVLGSAGTFNAAFALRLGATNAQIGLLSSIPALLAVLIAIPAGSFLHTRANRVPWLWGSLFLHRLGYLIIAFIPWLPIPDEQIGIVVIGLIIANTAAAHFFNVGFIPFMTEVIPVENRASVFAARNIISSATLSVCGFLFGIWLERILFPVNYTLMFAFGFMCSMISLVYLFKIKVPSQPEPVVEVVPVANRGLKGQLQMFSQAVSRYPTFARFTLNTLFHGIGLWLAVPLYVLYFVRELGATEGWLGINGTVATTATIIAMLFWRWRIRHWGEFPILKGSIILAGVYPIVVGLLHELPYILIATGLNALVTSAITLTHFNTMVKVIPGDKRPVYTAAYITVANLGAFICPLIGVELANRFGFEPVLIACGLLSIVGSLSFWVWPVQSPIESNNNATV